MKRKTIKVIDLLNLMHEGKAPENIVYDGLTYKYSPNIFDYTNGEGDYFLTNIFTEPIDILSLEIVIADENHKIEKIELKNDYIPNMGGGCISTNRKDREIYITKINEIIEAVNCLIDKSNKGE